MPPVSHAERWSHAALRVATGALLAAAIVVIGAVALPAPKAVAQEDNSAAARLIEIGFVEVFAGQSGPYHVRLFMEQENPVVGTVRVAVNVTDAESGRPVTDALVRTFANPSEAGERQYSPALNSPLDRRTYFALLEIEQPGLWTLDVEISNDLGQTLIVINMNVRSRARTSNAALGTALFALVLVAFAAGGAWIWWSSRKATARRQMIRESGAVPNRKQG